VEVVDGRSCVFGGPGRWFLRHILSFGASRCCCSGLMDGTDVLVEEGKGLGCIFHIFQDLGCNLGMYCSFILIFPSLSKKNEEWQEPDATNSAGKLQELGKRRHPIRHQRPLLKQLHVSVVDETIVRQVLKERSEDN
jgi:hypothetical protein